MHELLQLVVWQYGKTSYIRLLELSKAGHVKKAKWNFIYESFIFLHTHIAGRYSNTSKKPALPVLVPGSARTRLALLPLAYLWPEGIWSCSLPGDLLQHLSCLHSIGVFLACTGGKCTRYFKSLVETTLSGLAKAFIIGTNRRSQMMVKVSSSAEMSCFARTNLGLSQ